MTMMSAISRFRKGLPGLPGWVKTLAFGLAVGLFGMLIGLSPLGQWLDEQVGLSWLFELRGPRVAPTEAVILSIDRESATELGLPASARRWPREYHARLIETLNAAGARGIVFDVFFQEPRPGGTDQRLADAMEKAGNVVLFEYLTRQVGEIDDDTGTALGRYNLEQRILPVEVLKDGAAATGPFPLPKVPARVSQVWRFKPEIGGVPTLPMLAFQLHAQRGYGLLREALLRTGTQGPSGLSPDWSDMIANGRFQEEVKRIRHLFSAQPALGGAVRALLTGGIVEPSVQRDALKLLDAYSGPPGAYLNFYGPPGHLATWSYHRIIEGTGWEPAFRDKVVFVGFAERFAGEDKDSFHTVYSDETRLTSGVEILATAFGNLVDGSALRPLDPRLQAALFLVLGLIAGVVFRRVSGVWTLPSALLLGGSYLWAAHVAFAGFLWLPLATPLLVQLPLAAVGALLWHYLTTRRDRRRIREAFGYHLPLQVVDQLASGARDVAGDSDRMFGICLATDATQYTTLSERLDPGELRNLMNRYYAAVFAPVRRRGGIVSDVVGDAVLAIWVAAESSRELRQQACLAALELNSAVETFNVREAGGRMPTRVGIHCGELVLGHVGALDHYEYRVVGDIVNTATRIETLNKQIGTRMLVSEEAIRGLEAAFIIRPLGVFLLAGKSHPTALAELLGTPEEVDSKQRALLDLFADGLDAFRDKRWSEAAAFFERCLERMPDDGPAAFYLQQTRKYAESADEEDFDAVIVMNKK
ncbi:MAG: CHASE2 domain-containing protein [Pseudomonadota bacterium]